MQIILSDYNCEGQARAIFRALDAGGYLKLVPLELRLFVDVGLPADAEDSAVWQYCQDNGFVLLTGNRKTSDGERSLESTIRRLSKSDSLPVLTISNLRRVLPDAAHCKDCVAVRDIVRKNNLRICGPPDRRTDRATSVEGPTGLVISPLGLAFCSRTAFSLRRA